MNLGPSFLDKRLVRIIVNRSAYRESIKKCVRGKIKWTDKELAKIKLELRQTLRKQQDSRCVYCRRIIQQERRNVHEDIEHYLDKSKPHYTKFVFSPVNLSLSCRGCNFVKTTKDLGDVSIIARSGYTEAAGCYRWIHPYFDDYHANIRIDHGWIYIIRAGAPQTLRAENLIKECQLDEVARIEVYRQNLLDRLQRLTRLVGRALGNGQTLRAQRLNGASQQIIDELRYI